MLGRKRREREEQERVAAGDKDYQRDQWFRKLPAHDAVLLVKENGALVGTIHASEVYASSNGDLFEFLQEHEDFGPGYYTIGARYGGAFRGKQIHMPIGDYTQWRRGKTRAETQGFVDEEHERRKLRDDYDRNPVLTTLKMFADAGAAQVARDESPQAQARQAGIEQLAGQLLDMEEEDFNRACEMLRAQLTDDIVEAVFQEWRELKTSAG